jgi:hypothetical protein
MVGIAAIRTGSRIQQQRGNVNLSARTRFVQWADLESVCSVYVCAGPDDQLRYRLQLLASLDRGGDVQRGVADTVLDVRIGAVAQQDLDDAHMFAVDGEVQRREPGTVQLVDVRTGIQQ